MLRVRSIGKTQTDSDSIEWRDSSFAGGNTLAGVAAAENPRDVLTDFLATIHPSDCYGIETSLMTWMGEVGMGSTKPSFSGKNYGTFDSRFLWLLPKWDRERFKARVIDPAVLFMLPEDDVVPDLKTCVRRAGIGWDPVKHHRAVEDARMVVELNRVGLGRLWYGRG